MTNDARRRAERQGRRGEWLAIGYLALTGWKIIGRRVKTPLGEIDIIASRHKTLAFMEVKWRATEQAALEAFQPRQQTRLMRAAALWRSRRTGLNALATRFDLICVTPGRFPKHLKGVLSADTGPENHLI